MIRSCEKNGNIENIYVSPPLPQPIGKLSKAGANIPASYMLVKASTFLEQKSASQHFVG